MGVVEGGGSLSRNVQTRAIICTEGGGSVGRAVRLGLKGFWLELTPLANSLCCPMELLRHLSHPLLNTGSTQEDPF